MQPRAWVWIFIGLIGGSVDAAPAAPISGVVKPIESHLTLEFELSPAGSFTAKSDALRWKGVKVEGGQVQVDSVTLPLDTLKTGIALRDRHMTQKYFEVSQYPQAILKSIQAGGGKMTGVLQLRGVELPIQGETRQDGKSVQVEFITKISDFGIREPKYMGVGVEDEVKVRVKLPRGL